MIINTKCSELFVFLCDWLAFEKDDVYMGACFPQDECCILEATKLQRGKGSLAHSLGGGRQNNGRVFEESTQTRGSLRSSQADGSEITPFLSRSLQDGEMWA